MKTKFEIELEVPDNMYVYDSETGEKEGEKESKEFISDYFHALKDVITDIKEKIVNGEYDIKLEEYYNEDGELPAMTLTIKEVRLR